MKLQTIITGLSLILFTAGYAPVAWSVDAGSIQKINGDVTITGTDNVSRKATARDKIQVGDTISTDAKSEILIKMADDSTVALRANTQFQFSEFKYDRKPDTDSSIVRLLRGTARIVTGLIGKRNVAAVRINTPTATIGIRGTDFDVAVIPEDTADTRAGVYDYVRDGTTNIKLAANEQNLDVKKGQTGFAPDKLKPGEPALQILQETPVFLRSGGGLDALIQSITVTIPMMR